MPRKSRSKKMLGYAEGETVKVLRPVFTGRTVAGEKITLYQHMNKPEEIHICLPNDELWALSPGAEVHTWLDTETNMMRVDINSPEWTGQATGSRWDLMQADAR